LSDVTSSLDTSKSMELDDKPLPGDGVIEEADQLVTGKQDDGPDSVENKSTEIQVRVKSPIDLYGLRRQPHPSRKIREQCPRD